MSWVTILQGAGSLIGGALDGGGSDTSGPCPGQPDAGRVLAAWHAAPYHVQQRCRTAWASVNAAYAFPMPGDPSGFAKACMGGSDCRVNTDKGRELNAAFLALMQYAPAQTVASGPGASTVIQQAAQPGPASGGGAVPQAGLVSGTGAGGAGDPLGVPLFVWIIALGLGALALKKRKA